jgi:hypothetical protein
MRLKQMLAATAFTVLGSLAVNGAAQAADDAGTQDPGAAPYEQAM